MKKEATSPNEELIYLIENIHAARFELAKIYDTPGVILDDDEAIKIQPLVNGHLVKKTDENSFTIRRDFKKLLDQPLGRARIAEIGTNLDQYVAEAEISVLQLMEIPSRNPLYHLDRRTKILEDISDSVASIYEDMEIAVDRLYLKTQSNFGLLAMSPSKQAENQLYINNIDKLLISYSQVLRSFEREIFQEDREVAEIVSALPLHCINIINKLSVINEQLRNFMFKQRQIELQAAKIKALINHINIHPGFRPENALEKADLLEQTAIFEPLDTALFPDVNDTAAHDQFAPLIEDIFDRLKLQEDERVDRLPSTLSGHKQKAKSIVMSPVEKEFIQMVGHVFSQKAPVSLKHYWQSHISNDASDVNFQCFLYESLKLFNDPPKIKNKPITAYAQRYLILSDIPHFSGNKQLEDLIVHPAKMARSVAAKMMEAA